MKLFNSPLQIKNLTLKNRFVLPPIDKHEANDGYVSDLLLRDYDERTRNGKTGLLVLEHTYVAESGKVIDGMISTSRDSDIPGLTKLAKVIHKNDTPVIVEINHGGSACSSRITGHTVVGPSRVPNPVPWAQTDFTPSEISYFEIREIIQQFADAAKRVKEAGFDGVVIHAAHLYLLSQFYSPIFNKRTDLYNGQTLDGRIRLHLEIIKAVKDAVGPDYLVGIRFGACDYMRGGATVSDGVEAAKRFESAGIDLIDISSNTDWRKADDTQPGYFRKASHAVRDVVSVPVILTGGITTGEQAEQLLQNGDADLIGVGRATMKDPNWVLKNME